MPCADCVAVVQPEPETEQVKADSPKEIIVRPATTAFPRILCTPATTQQQQPKTCVRSGTSGHVMVGNKYKVAAESVQKVLWQCSTSTLPADDSAPSMQVNQEPSQDCRTGPAQQQVPASALGIQIKQQASFNTVTSGEYSHLTIKQQPSVKASMPASTTHQLETPAVDSAPHRLQPNSIFLAGEDGISASDLKRGSSHSFDSCYLPVGEMPNFDFEAGSGELPQNGFWKTGQDAQMLQTQTGTRVDPAPHGEARIVAGQSKPWDWCSIMAQNSEQPPPCLPDLAPLCELPPFWCTTREQQAWQASWQQQQHEPQDLHPHEQQQQSQLTPCVDTDLHSAYPNDVASAECFDSVRPCNGAEAAWMMLPSV